jgi:hypothetical protein
MDQNGKGKQNRHADDRMDGRLIEQPMRMPEEV